MKNFDKDYELLHKQFDTQELAFKHHVKIMQELEAMGFVPKPEQKITVESPRPVSNPYDNLEDYRDNM